MLRVELFVEKVTSPISQILSIIKIHCNIFTENLLNFMMGALVYSIYSILFRIAQKKYYFASLKNKDK